MGLRAVERNQNSVLVCRPENKPSQGYTSRLLDRDSRTLLAAQSLMAICSSAPELGIHSVAELRVLLYSVLEDKLKVRDGSEHPFTSRKRSQLKRFQAKRSEFSSLISRDVAYLLDEILSAKTQRCASLSGLEEYIGSLVPKQLTTRRVNEESRLEFEYR